MQPDGSDAGAAYEHLRGPPEPITGRGGADGVTHHHVHHAVAADDDTVHHFPVEQFNRGGQIDGTPKNMKRKFPGHSLLRLTWGASQRPIEFDSNGNQLPNHSTLFHGDSLKRQVRFIYGAGRVMVTLLFFFLV